MKLVFVHNPLESIWHRAEVRDSSPVPLRKALCGERAQTVSAAESYESWAHLWNRAIDPNGEFCPRCDDLAKRINPARDGYVLPSPSGAATSSVDAMLASVWGDNPPDL